MDIPAWYLCFDRHNIEIKCKTRLGRLFRFRAKQMRSTLGLRETTLPVVNAIAARAPQIVLQPPSFKHMDVGAGQSGRNLSQIVPRIAGEHFD